MNENISRRALIKAGMLSAITTSSFESEPYYLHEVPHEDPWKGFRPGVASYSFRKFDVDKTIQAMQRLGLKYISIKDFHLSLKSTKEERQQVAAKFRNAGITPLSCGNITMKNDEADIRNAFEYAKDCGIPTIVCSPDPASMAILDKMVKEYDIKLAIHNHGPEDKKFPSPYDVWNAVRNYDKRIGLCIDVGHTARAKVNPAESIIKCKERLYDLHFKDINTTAANGETIAAGRGVLDLRSVVRSLIKIKYEYLFSIEYESSPDDPVPEIAETLGYAKGLIQGLS